MNSIYVLDDEPSIGIILNLNLKDNYNVISGLSFQDFKNCNEQVDGLILDLNIGDDNGIDVLKALRNNTYAKINKNIPVIILSAQEDTKTKIECLAFGADDFMVKPFNPRELKARLNRLFSREKALKNG